MTQGQQGESLDARVARERETYERGLNRGLYEKILAPRYTRHLYRQHCYALAAETLRDKPPRSALEIGAIGWLDFLEGNDIQPEETHCINIIQKHLDRGISASRTTRLKPAFHIMDAHQLQFPDNSFDFVFGSGVLHHLDLSVAFDEMNRVLRPDGIIMFMEPLNTNPVAKLVRWLTPSARTPDESALEHMDLQLIADRFQCVFDFEQFLSVPIGIIARPFFKNPNNPLTRAGYRIDEWLKKAVPTLGPYYRCVLIIGRKHGKPASVG